MGFFHLRIVRGVEVAILWITAVSFGAAVVPALASELERIRIPYLPGSGFSAYPSVERLDDGRLLCVFSARYEPQEGKLVLASTFSEDHGRSWSQPEVLLNTADGHDYDPSIIVIGRRIIVSATTTPLNQDAITTSRIIAVRSDDSGATWSAPYEIPTGRRYTSGKINNGVVLSDGTALLGFTWEKNLDTSPANSLASEGDMEEVNAVLLSFDEGRTWAASESIGLDKRKSPDAVGAINGLCEPALVQCEDESIFMLSRTGLTHLYGARSTDAGRTWSEPFQTPLVSHNAPASICKFRGKRPGVLAVWNNSPKHRWPLSVAASFDGCRTWTDPKPIAKEDGFESSYPGCVQTDDGKLLVLYQQARSRGRDILGVRFDPSWLGEPGGDEESSGDEGASSRQAASEPRRLAHFPTMPKPAVLPDGTLAAYFIDHEGPGLSATPEEQTVYARYSDDEGETWGEKEILLTLPKDAGGFGYFVPLVDDRSEVHFFMLCDAGTGVIRPRPSESGQAPVEPLARQRLDIWHVKSSGGRSGWTVPKPIWQGRAGDLQSVTQLSNGRIVLPVSYYVDRNWSNRGEGLARFTYTGQFDTTVIFSDDAGDSWQESPSVLRTVTPDLSSYGAVEPVVLELTNGCVWMLLRTQLGRFYESYSDDGSQWSPPRPSTIKSSDSPAALVRLPDRRILMLWNNCQRHPYAQGSRHVLHAGLSADEGETWIGYREVQRDPFRDVPPPPTGDHGVSYPFAAVDSSGNVIYSLWVQSGSGRSLARVEPAWLEETTVHDDFKKGLDDWSTFGTEGVALDKHPSIPGRKLLSLENQNKDWPTAAVWNFPKGARGRLTIEMMIEKEAPMLSVQLSDHFSPPADDQSHLHCVFHVGIGRSQDRSTAHVEIEPETWTTVELDWDCTAATAELRVNGHPQQVLRQQHVTPGPSYLRLVMPAGEESSARVFVRQVDAVVKN